MHGCLRGSRTGGDKRGAWIVARPHLGAVGQEKTIGERTGSAVASHDRASARARAVRLPTSLASSSGVFATAAAVDALARSLALSLTRPSCSSR